MTAIPISPTGRWGGRLTSTPLPLDDPSVELLSTAQRRELADHWIQRGAFERRVGDAFEFVSGVLKDIGAPDDVLALAVRGVDDEMRHAEISRVVAERFLGAPVDDIPVLPLHVPEHPGTTLAQKRTLWIVGQCALNETYASAVLEASHAAATGALARVALKELLADEVDHARIGWAHLASLSLKERRALEPWLIRLVRGNLRMWRIADRVYPSDDALVAHGAMTTTLLQGALDAALNDLVLPGLQHLGFNTAEIETFIDDGAVTAP